ncbi:MAG TPA: glycosyltransferase family A protein [Candidatus Dormibacteraeota bacterium]|nr:glycosyltransferase family A protein [Candidatus Dormibacteraeota bacterium]
MPAPGVPAVSVVIPTYHRPEMLRTALESVLAQELVGAFEVVVALSDPEAAADRAAAEAVAAADPRVHVTAAPSSAGPASARNAGIRAARGGILAFIDDDCRAEPGWLAAGVSALGSADLVQGRTDPERPPGPFDHFVAVHELSWLWETCNLFVRRESVDAAGGLPETRLLGGAVDHRVMGEDTEWGWRLVRAGARPAFAEEARVLHAVVPRGFGGHLAYHARMRYFPRLLLSTPEAARHFWSPHFVTRRHAVITASLGLLAAGEVARRAGRRRLGRLATVAGAAGLLSPARRSAPAAVTEAVVYGSAVWGSIRWRRILL